LVADSFAGFPRLDDVVLATSELVTNAVQHGDRAAGRGVTLRLMRSTDGVRVEVSNAGAGAPMVGGFPPAGEMTGRGLAIAAEVTSRMGFSTDGGVTAWFEVDA
jgi:anti-sigma regulatory factor (Ser/Thr protein kinase)